MRHLSYQIIFFLFSISLFGQSPHGDKFDIDCSVCHNANSWKIDLTKITFDHSKTNFALIGQHQNVDCKSCHRSLVFSKMEKECFSCHKDIHQATVGLDCANCHTPTTWIVKDIVGLHQKGRFPLLGAHKLADCAQCHSGYAELNFEPLNKNSNLDCYACHAQNYNSTQNPNHVDAKFSTDCQDCHNINALSWSSTNVDHSFFPLVGGHALPSCFSCHQQGGNFSGLSPDCYSCHRQTYEATQNPNHIAAGLPTTCNVCHNINGWTPASFNHDITQFPLTGKHINVDCSNCHTNGYTGTPTDCYACHRQDYESVTDPNHVASQFSTDCSLCHTTAGWEDATFDHNLTQFPLTGAHQTVDCAQCHSTGYTGTPTDCYACHQTNYNNTTNPNHQALSISTDCASCHSTNADWQPAQFPQHNQYFELLGRHLEIINDCNSCHNGNYNNTPNQCVNCHQQNYNNAVNPNHSAAGISTECASCHNSNGWSPSTFDHTSTGFTLLGAHQPLQCSSCHIGTTSGLTSDCISCHQSDYNSAANHTAQSYPTTCEMCHNSVAWNQVTFNHQNTNFPLTGAHQTVPCSQCHQSGYTGTPTDCFACHETDYNNTTNPNHQAVSFPTTCVDCHTTTAWQPATFDHDAQYFPIYSGKHNGKWNQCSECHTIPNNYSLFSCIDCHEHNRTDTDQQHQGVQAYIYNSDDCYVCHPQGSAEGAFNHATSSFPLTGVHLTVDCVQCHQNGYSGTPTDCYACHQTNYNNAANPNHQALSISTDCATCHSTNADWQPAQFPQHNQYFELLGRHLEIINDCNSCHNGNYSNTPNQCVNCHQQNYNNAVNPNHSSAGISTECASCHNSNGWSPSTFDHSSTGFTLLGAHQPLQCSSCHIGTTSGLTSDCISCHQSNYNSAPNHTTQSYPTACEMCHNSVAWNQVTFNHQNTNFPLTGAHQTVPCSQCHQSGYAGTPTDCYACHQTNYNNTTNPNHQALSLSTDCATCHSTNADWQPAQFPQHNQYFELLGRHLEIINDCNSCHNGNYNNTPNQCVNCHQQNYNNAVNPNHSAAGISTECATCHNANGWSPSTFDHSSTGFILLGAHQPLQCSSCHIGTTSGLTSDCLSCHQSDYNSAANHTAQSYPTTCEMCHNSVAWNQVTFNHQNTNFPLTGAHQTVPCAQCHQSGYTGTPTDCFACHQTDYQQSTNPSHTSLVLATTCQTCHTTNAGWAPATFPVHNDFYQLLGAHLQINNCADCHQGNYNNTPNTCIGCHQNDYNSTTDPPHQTLNFSDNCLTCHTMNGWTPAIFDHNFYPVGSNHNNVNCNECHSQPNYQPQCLSCHLNDFNEEHDPGEPTDCWGCHSTSNWDSNFDHSNTNFPLTGAHRKVDCAQCHKSEKERVSSECVDCHLQEYLKSVTPNHKAMGISTDCVSCHNTYNWDSNIKMFEKNEVY